MTVLESTMTRATQMTESEYRAHKAISYSFLRDMLRCEAELMYRYRLSVTAAGSGDEAEAAREILRRIEEDRTSDAMLVGKLFEAQACGNEDATKALLADPRIIAKSGPNKGQPKSEYKAVHDMLRAWRERTPWDDAKAAQQQVQLFGVLNGVEIKGMLDLWFPGPGIVEDIKTVADLEDEWADPAPWWPETRRALVPWWQASRYDLQAAMYLTLLELNDVRPLEYRLRAVTKQSPPDVAWLWLARRESPQAPWEAAPAVLGALAYLPTLIDRAALLRAGGDTPRACYRCDYCRANKRITQPRKGW